DTSPFALVVYGDGERRHLDCFPTRRSSDLELNNIMTGEVVDLCVDEVVVNHGYERDMALLDNSGVKVERANDYFIAGNASSESRSEEHTSELQSRENLVCRLLLAKKNATGS